MKQAERIDEINERLNRLIESEYPEPGCTCTQTDVDVFDSSSCDFCDNSSQWNRDRRRAEAAVKDAAFHDIDFLLRTIGQRRDADGVEVPMPVFDPAVPAAAKSIP